MTLPNDTSVSDTSVAPQEGALKEGTDTGSSEATATETQDTQGATEKEVATDPVKVDGELDVSDPDYWQKKYQRDEENWKKRHGDLMSARQKAEQRAAELEKVRTTQQPVLEKTEPSTQDVPESFETTQQLTEYIEKKAAQIAEKQVRTYFEQQDQAKAQQAQKESYNSLWEQALKTDPALDVNELAAWMQKENVFNPLHALDIRNKSKLVEEAERRGAEKVLAKLKSNKDSATEGSAKTAPVAPKKISKDQRARYIQEILESGERDSSH